MLSLLDVAYKLHSSANNISFLFQSGRTSCTTAFTSCKELLVRNNNWTGSLFPALFLIVHSQSDQLIHKPLQHQGCLSKKTNTRTPLDPSQWQIAALTTCNSPFRACRHESQTFALLSAASEGKTWSCWNSQTGGWRLPGVAAVLLKRCLNEGSFLHSMSAQEGTAVWRLRETWIHD